MVSIHRWRQILNQCREGAESPFPETKHIAQAFGICDVESDNTQYNATPWSRWYALRVANLANTVPTASLQTSYVQYLSLRDNGFLATITEPEINAAVTWPGADLDVSSRITFVHHGIQALRPQDDTGRTDPGYRNRNNR